MSAIKQIVCISSHYWQDAWFRKQHFMSRFANKGFQIAYIEPSFSLVNSSNCKSRKYASNHPFRVLVDQVDDNIYIIKPPQYLPFWTKPFICDLNILYISYLLSRTLKKLRFKDFILWIYRPEFARGVMLFNYSTLITDIADDEAAYYAGNRWRASYMRESTEYLVQKSDSVIVTASTLYEKFKNKNKRMLLAPNGYDPCIFQNTNYPVPDEMRGIKHPIIGFVGTIFSFLDFELLSFIIRDNPEKSFVFVGDYELSVKTEWLTLVEKYENIYWLGRKPKETIPQYVNCFDVCINPFKVDEVSRSVSPLKVFEYLALKKPVVSVKMESLMAEKVARLIYFADGYDEFSQLIEKALNNKLPENPSSWEDIRLYSWGSIFERVYEETMSLLKKS